MKITPTCPDFGTRVIHRVSWALFSCVCSLTRREPHQRCLVLLDVLRKASGPSGGSALALLPAYLALRPPCICKVKVPRTRALSSRFSEFEEEVTLTAFSASAILCPLYISDLLHMSVFSFSCSYLTLSGIWRGGFCLFIFARELSLGFIN